MSNEPRPSVIHDGDARLGGRGDLFVISAPSGAGKTTLIRTLYASGSAADLFYSVSHTTRDRRPGEVDGRDYHFVDVPTFRAMIARDAFFEWADVHGQLKGTSAEPIVEQLDAGVDVLLDIDVQGAHQVRARVPDARLIFVLPPSAAELERRLRGRGLDDDAQIQRRLADSAREVGQCRQYDYVIVNDQVDRACAALAAVIASHRHRRIRQQPVIDRIVSGFASR